MGKVLEVIARPPWQESGVFLGLDEDEAPFRLKKSDEKWPETTWRRLRG